ncbi:MAG: adenylate/guanylate cyclase domain-containing protein [Betaproteobacteria bacterium]|nr:adenylate/guanylate cyclase domain-containing protein [Betaproteobacteria bacterium]
MALARPIRDYLSRLADPIAVSLAAALLGWLLIQTTLWRHVELKLFDFLVVHSAPKQVNLPITIIGIDEATFSELKTSWPLARRHHARLLDNLREARVAVVAFDITFPEEGSKEEDDVFMAAIQRFRRVVLASDLSFREDAAVRQWYRVDPHPMLLIAGAQQGYSSLEVDGDAVLRRVPTVNDAFWRAVVHEFDKVHPGVAAIMDADEDMRIRYAGGPHTFTYVPYHHVLDPAKHLPGHWKEFFKDNIVLVGRNLNVIGDVGAAQAEMYQTPFFYKTREFMPRVEVHANLVANMVGGEVLREAPDDWATGAWLTAVLAGMLFMRKWHPLRNGIALTLSVGLLAGLEYGVFARMQLWVPAAGAMMTGALIYLSQGVVAFIVEQRQRRELRNAFSMYVSPAVVDEVIAHPERLKLGGERREITILFTDLAGFTTISEGLEPEQVASVINRHLSGMTDTILEHSGTLDKFIGDGIMAFWGAPIENAKQSEDAVLAAIAMQKKMDAMSAEIFEETGAQLKMRVGINRGTCIVGNMGGSNRFDYTAMGDAINLASRLEGVNKVYGTKILASEAVIGAIHNHIRFREVDTVRVKGKHVGITVYTPCDDEALIAMHAEALAAYRAGDFRAAEQSWRRLKEKCPADPVAAVFLQRIAKFRKEGWPSPWDGIATLDEK